MIKVAVIILNWKQPQLTINTINSLKKINQFGFSYHIFLVDNGSSDNSLEIFQEKYSHDKSVTVIPISTNLGFAGGNNFGIKVALRQKFKYLLLINSDVIVDPDFLLNLIKVLERDNTIGLVGPKIYFAPGYEYHQERYHKNELGHVIWSVGSAIDWNNIYGKNLGIDEVDHGQYDLPKTNLESITACCLLIRSKDLRHIGLLSEDYFMYYEDNDFSHKYFLSGFKIAYEPTSKIWHLNSGSSTSGGGALHDYFLTRNRLIFGFKYASTRTKFALFRDSLRRLFIGTPWQKRGVVDFYFHRFGKGSWQ